MGLPIRISHVAPEEVGVELGRCDVGMAEEFLHHTEVGPAIEEDGQHFNRRWGYLTRCGVNDRSQLQRQVEKYADIYTSRVSNFGRYTPHVYFRSPAQDMTHDRPSADARLASLQEEG